MLFNFIREFKHQETALQYSIQIYNLKTEIQKFNAEDVNLGNFKKELKAPIYYCEEKHYYCFLMMKAKAAST